jgi:DNA (cytosine-5)-methyltransferase 1
VLLKTPTAQLGINGGSQHPSKRKAGGHGPTLADEVEHEILLRDWDLLPTPAARDFKSGESNLLERNARPLNEVAVNWLRPAGGVVDWGKFARAVLRWEQVFGHLVPCPLEPGRFGNLVLAPVFVEWMMGLEPGWVTDLPISRNAKLKLLGNGVVPQQVALALPRLLQRVPVSWIR